jgi:hypothetical protein
MTGFEWVNLVGFIVMTFLTAFWMTVWRFADRDRNEWREQATKYRSLYEGSIHKTAASGLGISPRLGRSRLALCEHCGEHHRSVDDAIYAHYARAASFRNMGAKNAYEKEVQIVKALELVRS